MKNYSLSFFPSPFADVTFLLSLFPIWNEQKCY